MLIVTFIAVSALAMAITGPVGKAVGNQIGVGSTVVLVWDIAKWPVIMALRYYGTAFGFYIATFSGEFRTYGSHAGVIVFLLCLWITNLALLILTAQCGPVREL